MQENCIKRILCTAAMLLAPLLAVRAAAGEVTGWYFHHSKNGEQPPVPPELAYVEKYDGYWIDHARNTMDAQDKVLYLTFDAGYENGNVAKILDILKEEEVPGAFFILEGLVKQEPELVMRMASEGHLVCNHTASHRDMTMVVSEEAFREELNRMETVYTELTGGKLAPYYRPPEGKVNEQNMKWAQSCGYKTVFWSFAYADWDNGRQMSPEEAKKRILGETHNGEVLLLHPTSAANAAVLQDLIRTWKEMGFRFGTLDELTGGAG
ncbi:MAG: polysaccharide deacetylase family protein [Clostridia bacterium]|nr:polysaccharide deacetylase family protein [Clostridia bacterium]